MILLRLNREQVDAPIVAEALSLGPVGPYIKTSLCIIRNTAHVNKPITDLLPNVKTGLAKSITVASKMAASLIRSSGRELSSLE
ncbi:hypothetical protein TNCV_913021 [Trichonephila clavipes]|nr:hypothetical protein TNCV_913021 [Trichonephila clavipes]